MSGADRPDWGPEEEEKEEEEKEEHEKLHSGDGGGSHCGAAAEPWEGGFSWSRRAASWVGSGSASARPGSLSSRRRGRRARACASRRRPSKAAAPRHALAAGEGQGPGLARLWVAIQKSGLAPQLKAWEHEFWVLPVCNS